MLYTIISDALTSGKITASDQTDIFSKIAAGKNIQLNAGYNNQAVSVCFENGLEPGVLKISSDVIEALSIPINLPYQLICFEKGLRIGPIIGLLMYSKRSAMTKKSLRTLLNYALLYKSMGGILYTFSVQDINFFKNTIEGYYYNPIKNKWEKGAFPFPDVIYKRVSVPKQIMQGLKKHIDNKIFNSRYFNKLEYWNMVSTSKSVVENIPITKEYISFNDIDLMLENFNTLFLKQVNGMRASGLIKLIKENGQYSFQGKLDESPTLFSSKHDAVQHFHKIKKNRDYIIQQAIDLLKFEDRYVDFRVVMQKDHTMDWQCTGIITSIGKQGGVCSNYAEDDHYMHFEDFFEKYLHLDKKEVFQKKNEVIDTCKKACMVLDINGLNCIDLGVDVGLDQNLKPWIFEINNRNHFHLMALFIKDYDMFFRVKTNPIKYVAKISGFNLE